MLTTLQIILSSSDGDFLDHLIPVLKDAANSRRTPALMHCLNRYSDDREADIERIGMTKHEEFLDSVNTLQNVREDTAVLIAEILKLNQSIQASTEKLVEQKGSLVNTKAIRQNIADASDALKDSLKVLHAVNHAHDLVRKKRYYSALKSLEDLQNEHLVPILQNRYATQHRLADAIQKSIPASRKAISEAVMADLNTWLFQIREISQFLGEFSFYHTKMRRSRQKQRIEDDEYLTNFKLNSAIELVCDESEEFDVLENEQVQVDFTPLFEGVHIHEALNQSDRFRSEYAATRRQQKDLLIPSTLDLLTEEESSLSTLLEDIAGFAIIERATMRKAPLLRTAIEVDELWESMCREIITLTSKALDSITNAESLLKIKGVIALFIQTMEGYGYSINSLDMFLRTLFDKYAELLKQRFSDDFQEVSNIAHAPENPKLTRINKIVSTDDYMPMAINSLEEYEKVINVSWYTPEHQTDDVTLVQHAQPLIINANIVFSIPCVLPFSQMYPLCCINIRNFLNQFYFFSDDHFQHSDIIDDSLRTVRSQAHSEIYST